jgi:hypothetical protein
MESQNTDFEAWARMLIARKVPEDSARFINPEVVRSGAEILRRGLGFEVHLLDAESAGIPDAAVASLCGRRIAVTPFPQPSYCR